MGSISVPADEEGDPGKPQRDFAEASEVEPAPADAPPPPGEEAVLDSEPHDGAPRAGTEPDLINDKRTSGDLR